MVKRKNRLFTDALREVKNTFSRFLSILVLSGLAVAFLAGLRAAAPDMEYTADNYFDGSNFMDAYVLSTKFFRSTQRSRSVLALIWGTLFPACSIRTTTWQTISAARLFFSLAMLLSTRRVYPAAFMTFPRLSTRARPLLSRFMVAWTIPIISLFMYGLEKVTVLLSLLWPIKTMTG